MNYSSVEIWLTAFVCIFWLYEKHQMNIQKIGIYTPEHMLAVLVQVFVSAQRSVQSAPGNGLL